LAQEALISEKRFTSRGLSGLSRKALPIPRGISSGSDVSPIPLEVELAFERGEISGRSYKSVVDKALEVVRPGTSMERTLLREQSAASRRVQDEQERAINEGRRLRKLQAQTRVNSTAGKTYEDAVSMYNFWINEGQRAEREGDVLYAAEAYNNASSQRSIAESKASASGQKFYRETAKELGKKWKSEDAAFEQDVKAINDWTRQGLLGRRVTEKGETVNERSYILAKTYQDWKAKIENRIRYLEANPDLNAKMNSGNNVTGLRFKLEGGITSQGNDQLGINDLFNDAKRLLATAPSTLALVANPEKNTVEEIIAPADIKFGYIKDEYGINHKLDIVKIDGGYVAVANVLRPDGTVVRVVSDPATSRDGFNPAQHSFFFEGGKQVTNLNAYGKYFEGRLGLTGADISSPEFIQDVLNISDPQEIQSIQADIKFKQLKDQNPDLAAKEALFGRSNFENIRKRIDEADALAYGVGDQVIGNLTSSLNKQYQEALRLRNEGILEGNPEKLRQSERLLLAIPQGEEIRTAELQRKRPLPLVTPRQQGLIEGTQIPRKPLPGNINLPSLLMTKVPGVAPRQVLGPLREEKIINIPKTKQTKGILGPPLKKKLTTPQLKKTVPVNVAKLPGLGKYTAPGTKPIPKFDPLLAISKVLAPVQKTLKKLPFFGKFF